MTAGERTLLMESVDQVVVLETGGETVLARILFVFNEGETPDVFYLPMRRDQHGSLLTVGQGGHSTLLSEIVAVRPLPEL